MKNDFFELSLSATITLKLLLCLPVFRKLEFANNVETDTDNQLGDAHRAKEK